MRMDDPSIFVATSGCRGREGERSVDAAQDQRQVAAPSTDGNRVRAAPCFRSMVTGTALLLMLAGALGGWFGQRPMGILALVGIAIVFGDLGYRFLRSS
jgi:hypothetical protein